MDNVFHTGLIGVFAVGILAVEVAALFGIVYAATRLAIRHERRVSG